MNTTKSIRLRFEGLPANPNKTKTRHWAANYSENQEWKTMAHYMAKQAYKGAPWERAHLHFHISVGDNRRHDADNIEASMKSVQDGLVTGGILVDDSIDNLTRTFSYDRQKPRGFVITITPMG